jgi:hypothetical protein
MRQNLKRLNMELNTEVFKIGHYFRNGKILFCLNQIKIFLTITGLEVKK